MLPSHIMIFRISVTLNEQSSNDGLIAPYSNNSASNLEQKVIWSQNLTKIWNN